MAARDPAHAPAAVAEALANAEAAFAAVMEIYQDRGRPLPSGVCVDETDGSDWGGRDLKTGTVRSAVSQLGIDWRRFQDA